MPVKPENQFISGVHKYLPQCVYHVKMNNPYVGGIPDVWYSGQAGDLWIEYKYIPRVPQRGSVTAALSVLQEHWLQERHQEGRSVGVIVGCPTGGVYYSALQWQTPVPALEFVNRIQSRADLAARISALVLGETYGDQIRSRAVPPAGNKASRNRPSAYLQRTV